MSTSTIQKITNALTKHSEDKKAQLNKRYEDHSRWLQNELDLIRNLILQTPVDDASTSSGPKCAPVPIDEVPKQIATIDSDTALREQQRSQKRKSPETALNSVNASPDQKRTSSESAPLEGENANLDIESLFSAAGLPGDLNRLKKEQLLVELEIRQVTHFTMKSLKKDLIEALRDAIIQTATGMSVAQIQSSIPAKAIEPEVTFNQVSAPSEVSPHQSSSQRKGSLLGEFRKSTSVPVEEMVVETEEQRNIRIQNEFEARQRRHRESQIRKSGAADIEGSAGQAEASTVSAHISEVSQSLSGKEAMECDDCNQRESTASTQYSAVISVDSIEDEEVEPEPEPAPTTTVVEVVVIADEAITTESMTTEDEELTESVEDVPGDAAELEEGEVPTKVPTEEAASVWMEISSPTPHNKQAPVVETVTSKIVEDAISRLVPDPLAGLSSAPVIAAPVASTFVATSTLSAVPATTSSDSAPAVVKKPMNLMAPSNVGGSSSFLDKATAPNKPVVLALEKAKQARELEEAKAAEKARLAKLKRDAAAAASTNNPITSSSSGLTSKPSAIPQKAAGSSMQPTSSVASSVTSATTTTIKKAMNMVGGLMAKKPTTAPSTTNSSVTSTTASTAASSTSQKSASIPVPAQIKSQAFDISVVSTPTAAVQLPPAPQAVSAPVAPPAAPITVTSIPTQTPTKPSAAATVIPMSTPKPQQQIAAVTPHATMPAAQPQRSVVTPGPAVAPGTVPVAPKPVAVVEQDEYDDEYHIEERDSSGSESGTDDDNEAKQKEKVKYPDWARSVNLKEALERQYGLNGHTAVDPDTIFPEVQTCSLEEIFGAREGRAGAYSKRTSSAHWEHDELSVVERRNYRTQMGFRQSIAPQPSIHQPTNIRPIAHPAMGVMR